MHDDIINLIGMPFASHGLGRDLRDKAHGFLDIGVTVDIAEVNYSSLSHFEVDERLAGCLTERPRGKINLVCMAPEMFRLAMRDRPEIFQGKVNILQPFWEFQEVPYSFISPMNASSEIWVPTKFLVDAFKPYVQPEVIKLPNPTESDIPSCCNFREKLGISNNSLIFLQIFHCNSLIVRKDPEASILAFIEAFHDNPDADVRLILKYNWEDTPSLNREQMEAFLKLSRFDQRIILLDQALSNADIAALMHACDVYLSPHRSEGLGRGIMEAMHMGKAVVATDYSGAADEIRPFIQPLSFTMVNVGPHAHGSIGSDLLWAQPDHRELARIFKELEANRARVIELGQLALKGAQQISGRKLFAQAALLRIEEIHKQSDVANTRFRLDSGERQPGKKISDIREDHLARYTWAVDVIRQNLERRPAKGADFLCGTGYGSTLLCDLAPIWAFDASSEAITLARNEFSQPSIEYTVAEFPDIASPGPFDFIVALEAIEHIQDYKEFLRFISENLADEGVAVVSTPDQEHLPWHPKFHKFHYKHFFPQEIIEACNEVNLSCIAFAGQAVYCSKDTHIVLPDAKDMLPTNGKRNQFALYAFRKTKPRKTSFWRL